MKRLAITLATALLTTACNTPHETSETSQGTVMDEVKGMDQFSTLADLLDEVDLDDTLKGRGPFTLFAPTNEAFKALPAGALDTLKSNKDQLRRILMHHVVKKQFKDHKMEAPRLMRSMDGNFLSVTSDNGHIFVDDIEVQGTPVHTSNGTILPINRVLIAGS